MSLHISAILPSGDCLIASDTRMCDVRPDGFATVIRDDIHKTVQLDSRTFVFMSGNFEAVSYAVQVYRTVRTCDPERNGYLLTNILRQLYDLAPETVKANQLEIMALYLMRCTDTGVVGELYLHSYDNYIPLYSYYAPGSTIVLGSYIPGTDDYIRATIQAAQTDDEMIEAFKKVYNEQCRAEVGGTLELFRISPIHGLVDKMSFSIKEDSNV